jgi:hypothetical protein
VRRLLILALALPLIIAAKPQPAPFVQQLETWSYSQNPDAPLDCMNEDDFHYRLWGYGPFSGSMTTTERLCDPAVDNGWNAGGVGMYAEITFAGGTFGSLVVTSPSGTQYPATLWNTQTGTKRNDPITYTYGVCVDIATDNQILEGGTWSVTLTGDFTQHTYYEEQGLMAPWSVYPDHCPR